MGSVLATVRNWPRRRWLAFAVFAPAMGALFAGPGGALANGAATGWDIPALLITAILAGAILASYVPAPGSRRLLEVGCSPCAVVAAASVIFAFMIRSSSPGEGTMAAFSILVLLAGLGQRLNDAQSCTVSTPPPPDVREHDAARQA